MPIKKINYGLVILFTLTALACGGRKTVNAEEYLRLINSETEGLKKIQVFNKIKYSCQMQTPEFTTLLRMRKNQISKSAFETEKKDYQKLLNFTLIIDDMPEGHNLVKTAVFSKDQYSSLLSYANTLLSKDFMLSVNNTQQIPCSVVHLEPANSVNPVMRIAISFATDFSEENDYVLIFDDNFFNNGKIKFKYTKDLLKHLPQIKFKS